MHLTQLRRAAVVPLVLALAVLACGRPAVEPTATPLPRPTQRPAATNTPVDAPDPTQPPRPTATQGSSANTVIDFADEPFAHASGAFAILVPDGWELDEKDNSIFITAPDDAVAIEVSFTNVGTPLDEDAFQAFMDAMEVNWFGTFEAYEAGAPELQGDGSYGILKTLELSSGRSQTVFSYYWQEDAIVYIQDFWVDTPEYETYVDSLLVMANSMTTDPAAVADVPPYAIAYEYIDPGNLFSFWVPYGWAYETGGDAGSVVDRFSSPDGLSYIENVMADDGTELSAEQAADFALSVLQSSYGADDLEVTDEAEQEDGSIRLTWHSPAGGFEGVSFYETRGTTFLILTWVVDSDFYDVFFPVWDEVVETYSIPEASEE